jgi:signal transduction histidine kinase
MESQTDYSALNKRIEVLKLTKVFSETEETVLGEIALELDEIKAKRNQNIFKKGEEGDAMYIIKSGSVRVHDGGHILSRLYSGQVFGEFALFDKESRSASVTADEPVVLYRLSRDNFYRIMAEKAEVTKSVLRKVIKRIREMNELESKLAKSYLKIQRQKNEIEEQRDSILKQKAELEEANNNLIKLNEEKNRLISVVSHGLRNPLTSSLSVIDLLENETENLSEDQKEYIRLISNSLRRMNSMINQTLDIDTIQLQRSNLKPEKVNLARILKQVEKSFKYALKIKKLTLELKTEDLFVEVDRNFIFLIFDNIVSNAVKFSPSDSKITIDLFQSGNDAIVEISDEGPGISREALHTLFDKPQIHGRQKDRTGLSIVKKYVEAMHGKIECLSKPGQGTTFVVSFRLISID